MFESRIDLDEIKNKVAALKAEVGKIIVGQEKMLNLLICALLSKGHVLIEGYPGLAKTLTAKLLSKIIDTDFKRIQFTPDLMPSDIIGTTIFNARDTSFEFRKGPIFSNIVLIDEINRAPAKTQAALFEVMEERQISYDSIRYPMDTPFMIIATQNPIDFEGTYRLPEAQMDRFLFRIHVSYPKFEEEVELLGRYHEMGNTNDLSILKSVIKSKELLDLQALASKIHVESQLMKYIVEIVHKTRAYKGIEIGASPRASLAILTAAKSMALIHGRDFVTPEDILETTNAVLNHRIILTAEKELEGVSNEFVLNSLIKSVEIPRFDNSKNNLQTNDLTSLAPEKSQ